MAAACHDDSMARESHTYPLPVAIPCNALTHFFPRVALRISHASPLRLSCRPLLSQLRPSDLARYIPCRVLQAQSPFSYIVHQSFEFLSCPFLYSTTYISNSLLTKLLRSLHCYNSRFMLCRQMFAYLLACKHADIYAPFYLFVH